MYISKEFKFDSAHQLIEYNGKCENLHGHTYKLRVTLKGEVDKKTGMIIDFTIFKKIVNDNIIEKLDHNYLNNIIKQPTAENIVKWIWNELYSLLKGENYKLYELILWETEDSFVILRDE